MRPPTPTTPLRRPSRARRTSPSEERVRPPLAQALYTWRKTMAVVEKVRAAELLGVSESTWGRMESGGSDLSVPEMLKLESIKPGLVALIVATMKPRRRAVLRVPGTRRRNPTKTRIRS